MEHKGESISKPIRLIYIIGTYPGLTTTFIDSEINTLSQMGGFEIKIVSLRTPPNRDELSPWQQAMCQETLYLIPSPWSAFTVYTFILANLNFIFSQPLVYFGTLAEFLIHSQAGIKAWMMTIIYFLQGVYAAYLLRSKPFDHLHVHFMDRAVLVALVVGRFLRKPYSFTAHAVDIYTKTSLARQKIANASFMVTVSQYNKQYLLNAYPGINPDKIFILHPWVDISLFAPCADRPVHNCLHILSVGRLVEKKGHTDLIEACQLMLEQGLDFECRIIGDGPLRADLEKQIEQQSLKDRVSLMGGRIWDDVMDQLKGWADIFALPCVIAANGDRDGMPVSLAEAMAMELPVVSTDIIGISELVRPGTGVLVGPRDACGLAEALKTLYAVGPAGRLKMGRLGRGVVDNEFNLHKGIGQLAGFFRNSGVETQAPIG